MEAINIKRGVTLWVSDKILLTRHFSNSLVIILTNGEQVSISVSLSEREYNDLCNKIENKR